MEKKLYFIRTNAEDFVVSEHDGEYRIFYNSPYLKGDEQFPMLDLLGEFEDYKKAAYKFLKTVKDDSSWDEMEIVATAFVNI